MYLMYVDESGDIGINKSPTQYYILSSLIFHEWYWNKILDDLLKFRKHLKGSKGLKIREEIHSVNFLCRPKELIRIKRNDRVDILKQCIDWAANYKNIFRVISIVVDKSNKANQEIVFQYAWERLIQRFENTIKKNNFPCPDDSKYNKGLIISDNTNGGKLTTILRKMRRFNPVSDDNIFSTKGYRDLKIKYIIEDPYLKNSKDSLLHQMVDVIAYSVKQLYEPNIYMKKKGGNNFYKRLDPILLKIACKNHPLGIVEV